jgi:hypothetical protein
MKSCLTQFHDVTGPTTEKPTTTTTKPSHNTPGPDDYDITVYVSGMSANEVSNCI